MTAVATKACSMRSIAIAAPFVFSPYNLTVSRPLRIRLCESAVSFAVRKRLAPLHEIAPASPYDRAVPGSAILRCCLASTSFGVTFATVVWILFFNPVTMSDSPRSIASNPALATS